MRRSLLLAPALLLACSGEQAHDPPPGSASASSASASSASASSASAGGAGGADVGAGGGKPAGLGPGKLGTLTVTLALRAKDEAAANATPLRFCLSKTRCFDLVRPFRQDLGKREAGPLAYDVHTFEKVGLDHASVDRFELRASPDAPASFAPGCLSVRFDGKPLFCSRGFEAPLGKSWKVPVTAASTCGGCFSRGEDAELSVTHGPFVGARDAAAGTARIWLRADASLPVSLFVAGKEDMSDRRLADTRVPRPEDDFTVTLSAAGLAPGARYFYEIEVGGARHAPKTGDAFHPGGRYPLRMPPAPGKKEPFSFALGSCARMFKHGNYDAIRDQKPAFFLSVGDYHYGNVLEHHFVDRAKEPYDHHTAALNDLRWWYRTAHWEKESLLATVPTLNTWDDHDYGGGHAYADREAEGRAHSRRAMLEYFANPERSESPEDLATYFRFSHGDADFFVLDARWHRPRLCEAGGKFEACDPGANPLGKAQSDWLVASLEASQAAFKFVAAGTRFYGGGIKDWAPFLAARDALLARIAKAQVGGVIFLSGGPHKTELRAFSSAGKTWRELVSSPLSSGLSACPSPPGACYADVKNFVMVDVDPAAADPTLTLRVVTYEGDKPWPGPSAKLRVKRSELE